MNSLSSIEVREVLAKAGAGATVYLVGAGGCGMSGLGHLLLDAGFQVAGSDLALNTEIEQLRSRGANIFIGHAAEHITGTHPRLVVYSSAIRLNNPELAAAASAQIPIARRAVLLAALMHQQRGVCIAGMHGKTTTTALLAHALQQLQARPSFAVGALVPQFARHAHLEISSPSLPYFIVEADESDGTLSEFHPEQALILNVDEEHLDYYANLEAICTMFSAFAEQTKGALFYCADDHRLLDLFSRHPRAISFGYHPLAHYRISLKPAGQIGKSVFEVWRGSDRVGEFQLALLGEKNISNATGVIAFLHEAGYAPERIRQALGAFRGAARRQQELFRDARYRVFDDYGHHPSEIQATLRALKNQGCRRLLVAFQPHRFTRTQQLLSQFATCFQAADELWIADVYAASEAEIPGVNGSLLAEAIRKTGQRVAFVPHLRDLPGAIYPVLQPGDMLLFLGAGDITTVAHLVSEHLRMESPTVNEELFTELSNLLSSASVLRRNEPLAKRTTLRVGGTADIYAEPASEAELAEVLKFCKRHQLPFMILGRGSNLLIRDGGIRGVVISLAHAAFSRLEISGQRMHCGAGVKLKAVSVEARRHGLAGLEFLEGIPGSVGGALRMNAGAMGSWMFEVVESVRFMDEDGQVQEKPAGEVHYEYRGCPLFKNHIALGAVLQGKVSSKEVVEERMMAYSKKRWESQPAAPSAGCIFKNPKTIPAGKLIDELGLKGTRVGGAVVSDEHGNFIVNDGNATASDVLSLIEVLKERVRTARGIELETEVEIIGEPPRKND